MGPEQPSLVEGGPAHGRGIETRWPLRYLSAQTILLVDITDKIREEILEVLWFPLELHSQSRSFNRAQADTADLGRNENYFHW